MAAVAIERLASTWGDLSIRDPGYPPLDPFNRLAQLVIVEPTDRALDAVGAWIDAYSGAPNTASSSGVERAFLDALEDRLIDTTFAVRGRDIVSESGTVRNFV